MMDENKDTVVISKTAVERHAQTILVALITAGIVFVATRTIQGGEDATELKTQVSYLSLQITELRADVKSMQAGYVRADQFVDLSTRVRAIEERLGRRSN